MNNWHRMIWTLQRPKASSPLKKLFNKKKGATNEFWFEPTIDPTSNALRFSVGFKPGAMVAAWSTCSLEPKGSVAFVPRSQPTQTTERLEGTIVIAKKEVVLRFYLFDDAGKQVLDLRRGKLLGGFPDTGAATAHN